MSAPVEQTTTNITTPNGHSPSHALDTKSTTNQTTDQTISQPQPHPSPHPSPHQHSPNQLVNNTSNTDREKQHHDAIQNDDYFPQPPIMHDHLRPSKSTNATSPNPSLIATLQQPITTPIPFPPSHPKFISQPSPQQQQQQQQPQQLSRDQLPVPVSHHYHTMPINDPNKTTIAFDMYIPKSNNQNYTQEHPSGCDCCPHHHKRKDNTKILYRHLKKPTWGQYISDKIYLTWEFLQQTYWHIEPWVVRPLLAGIAYNVGIQLARVCIQHFFPTFFPTTVYLPLRANAKFYDLHAKRVQIPDEVPMNTPNGSKLLIESGDLAGVTEAATI
jgi:hypothetical protein